MAHSGFLLDKSRDGRTDNLCVDIIGTEMQTKLSAGFLCSGNNRWIRIDQSPVQIPNKR